MTETLSPAEATFWQTFDAAVADANHSTGEISRITAEAIDHPVAESTIRNWCQHRRLPRDEQQLLAVIKAVHAEKQCDWLTLLRAAHRGRNSRTTPNEEPVADTETKTPPRRSTVFVAAGVAGAVLVLFAALIVSANTDEPDRTAKVCAEVTTAVAGVFAEPGVKRYDKVAKYHGDQVVLYRDMPETTGPDGQRYRAIRSPARAKPGKSPYSWMLTSDLSEVPCTPRS